MVVTLGMASPMQLPSTLISIAIIGSARVGGSSNNRGGS